MLAIDASDSMNGDPEAGAIAAAQSFVAQRRGKPGGRVVTFNGNVNVVQAPTIDPGQLQRGVGAVRRSWRTGRTSVRCGLALAQAARRGEDLRRLDRAPLRRRRRRQHEHADTGRRGREGAEGACVHGRASLGRVRRHDAARRSRRRPAAPSPRRRRRRSSPASTPQLGSQLSTEYVLDVPLARRSEQHGRRPASRSTASAPHDAVQGADAVGAAAVPPAVLRRLSSRAGRSSCSRSSSPGSIAIAVRLLARRDAFAVRRPRSARSTGDTSQEEETASMRTDEDWRRRATRARTSGSAAARGWLGRFDEQIDIGRIKVSSMTIIAVTRSLEPSLRSFCSERSRSSSRFSVSGRRSSRVLGFGGRSRRSVRSSPISCRRTSRCSRPVFAPASRCSVRSSRWSRTRASRRRASSSVSITDEQLGSPARRMRSVGFPCGWPVATSSSSRCSPSSCARRVATPPRCST